jgi:hypothetical protein
MTLRAVDGIEFLVLVDNCLDSLSSVPKNVSLEWPRLMRNGMRELSGEAFARGFGKVAIPNDGLRTSVHVMCRQPCLRNATSPAGRMAWF